VKLCLYCKHWELSFEADWSEVTPGAGFESRCLKSHWYMNGNETDTRKYRENMEKGLTCPDFAAASE